MRRGVVIDARTGALIALLSALGVVHKVMEPEAIGISRQEMEATARRIAEADWAAGAVRSAVDTLTAAIIAASAWVVVAGSG